MIRAVTVWLYRDDDRLYAAGTVPMIGDETPDVFMFNGDPYLLERSSLCNLPAGLPLHYKQARVARGDTIFEVVA